MKHLRFFIFTAGFLIPITTAQASAIEVTVGPAGVGIGHPNPITFQSALEYEITYVHSSDFEFNLAVIGVTAGKRYFSNWGGFTGIGAGIVTAYNGTGPGLYASFGYNPATKPISPVVEFTQLIGISRSFIAPYALRIGAALWF